VHYGSALDAGRQRLSFSASIVARNAPSTDLSALVRPSNISSMIVEGVRAGSHYPLQGGEKVKRALRIRR